MPQERVILDPAEKAEGRVELDITPWLDVEGIDWGDAEMEAFKAEAQVGESVIHYRLPNRQISAPLVIKEQGGTSFATARSYIQAKVARCIQEGGIGKRILSTGGTAYFDIVANGLSLGGDWLAANKEVDTEAELRIEALPDFYEPEVEVASAEEKTATELIKVIPDPGGDMPARVRVVVEEKQGADQKGLIWSFRSRHYSSATTAKVAYEAEELHLLDTARKVALTGASGGTVVQHGTISKSWTPVVGGRLAGTAFPTHTGTNRFFARVYSTSGTAVRARLVYDVGDLVNPDENAAYQLPGASNFYIADLGEVRLDPPPVGTHRWDWQIQAAGEVGNEDFKVDKVWVLNADEYMGVLTASPRVGVTSSGFAAEDTFTQSAGTLTGKTALRGGVWDGAGDADDFTINTTSQKAQRTATGDSSFVPRYAILGTGTFSDIAASVDVETTNPEAATERFGVLVRYVDTNNWLSAHFMLTKTSGSKAYWHVSLWKRVAGTISVLGSSVDYIATANFDTSVSATVECVAISSSWQLRANGRLYASGTDTDLGSGGALEKGKVGLRDEYTSAAANTRTYDNFQAWVPTHDAVVYASQKAQLTTNGIYRLDSGGSAYGPVSRVIGDLPRLPAGGLEGRSTELFLKASRGDFGELPDSSIDDLAMKVHVARSWLTVPGTL